MTLSLHISFNGSAINLLISRDEATLGRSHQQQICCYARPDTVGYSTVTNYLRQPHFPSALCETPDELLHRIHWYFP
jgi:hypothetical protein